MYFGCWLDINRIEKRFPLAPPAGSHGPWPADSCNSIQELMRARHQCLVAEVYLTTAPTTTGETPATSSHLSQRNLAILHADNPGLPGSRLALHTFEIKPSPISLAVNMNRREMFGLNAAIKERMRPDELLFHWHNLPRDSEVTLYFSDIDTADILRYSTMRLSPPAFEVVDKSTIRFKVANRTWLPIPGDRKLGIPALLSVKLPDGIVYGQNFRISVHQVNGHRQRMIGAFDINIPVTKAEFMLDEEIRTLSVMKYIGTKIPTGNRW